MKLKVFLFILSYCLGSFAYSSERLSQSNKIIFGTKSSKLSVNKTITYDVTFEKEKALNGQLFLLTTAGISTGPAPTGNAFASKIIFFERRGKSLSMFETTEGKMVTTSITTKKFLTELPIISEDEKYLTVDFSKGMSSIVIKDGMHASDGGPSSENILIVTSSFIESVEQRNQYLFINQFIQYQVPGTREFGDYNLKYTFSTYEKNPNFKPKRSIGFKKLGYFESHPMYDLNAGPDDVDTYTNILKFSLEKPITYYVSRNVPPEFKQAVLDGILYWNTVFGREVVKADELPVGVSVHEPGYNIVQWLDWDTAGFAYADIQSNPITGEILQSHVYMTSSFAKGGLRTAKEYLKKLLTLVHQDKAHKEEKLLGLKGFKTARTCHIELESFLGTEIIKIEKLIQEKGEDAAKEVIERFAADYVREVLAHEVGHTLGLRHNFAGSIGTNISTKDYENVSNLNFLSGIMPPGLYPSTSVMDYTQIFTAAMIGSVIRAKAFPLPYDKLAIDWGYNDVKINDLDPIPYCTDSSQGDYNDCKVWDQTSNPILFSNFKWKEVPDVLSFTLAMDLEDALKRNKELAPTLRSLRLSPEGNAQWMAGRLMALLQRASNDGKYLQILNKYPDLSALNQNEYLDEVNALRNDSFNSLGGLANATFGDVLPDENLRVPVVKNASDLFFFYLEKMDLEQDRKDKITLFYKNYFSVLEKEFLLNFSKMGQGLSFEIKDEKWLGKLGEFGVKTIFTNSGKVLTTFEEKNIVIPFFDYQSDGADLRSELIKFVGSDFYPKTPSYGRNRDKLTNQMVGQFVVTTETLLGEKPKNELPDPVYDWFAKEVNRFLPIMPRSLQMKYMQDLMNL